MIHSRIFCCFQSTSIKLGPGINRCKHPKLWTNTLFCNLHCPLQSLCIDQLSHTLNKFQNLIPNLVPKQKAALVLVVECYEFTLTLESGHQILNDRKGMWQCMHELGPLTIIREFWTDHTTKIRCLPHKTQRMNCVSGGSR